MRILLLAHGLPPDSVGGVEQHVDGLARALVTAGHDVEIFAREGTPGLAEGTWRTTADGNPRITRVAYRWERVPDLAAMYLSPPMATALRGFLRQRAEAGVHFAVAHVHHLTGMSTDSLGELAAAGVPSVMTLHDYWLFCPRGQMFHHREEVCETATVPRCGECLQRTWPGWVTAPNRDAQITAIHARALAALAVPQRLVVPSARAIPPFEALGVPRARFTVVENGVDTDALAALPPPAIGPGPLRVGYLGTVMPSKGLHVLLAAAARLSAHRVAIRIHGNVVPYHGDAGYATRCFASLRPQDDVQYHGPYGLHDLPTLLAGIDVLAAPALWHEAFGLTVREALAAARPVLVSRIGGLQDAIVDGEQGLVLPPGDVDAWAEALARLAASPAAVRAMSQRARQRARGFAAMADDLLAVYREAAADFATTTDSRT
jgi:glycosyltransferase involved in cell wall biosynthesis